jgi:hypothetical protein
METNRMVLAAAAVVAVSATAWYFLRSSGPAPVPAPAPLAQVAPVPAPERAPAKPEHYPAPAAGEEAPAKPLPALDESDGVLLAALAAVIGREAAGRFLVPERLVRNIVVTVDNLPRKSFAMRLSPLKPVGGLLATTGKDESLAIAPENAARYAPWVALLEKVDAKRLVAVYARAYPLFQQAYVELGYPDGHFNTRLVQVIDHLLAAPEPAGPLRLVVPHVLAEYADPKLEAESAGRKVLLRMGNANAAKVKAKLLELRRALVDAG